MIKTIIVDDEPLALDILEAFIQRMPELELVARCNNAFEANDALHKNEVELMFLDINMPQMTGVEFLKSLSNPPMTIFTTAYPEYAVEGFELNAVDYLLKPIAPDRFMKAVNRAVEIIELKKEDTTGSDQDHFFVKADKKMMRINLADIVYIEGLKDYVLIHLSNNRIATLQTMKSLEDKLPVKLFARIHRSYIVGIDKIQAIVSDDVEVLIKGQPRLLPIGKNYRDELMVMITKNKL
jgi:DNA-binding LytR/AlgR family response regulator